MLKKLLTLFAISFIALIVQMESLWAKEASAHEVEDVCVDYPHTHFSLEECSALANSGDSRAQGYLGSYYARLDYQKAEDWYLIAIKNGNEWAGSQLESLRSGKEQGTYENLFVFLASIFIVIAVSFFLWRDKSTKRAIHVFLTLFPLYFCILLLLIINSLGEWGSLKHPWLSKYAEVIKITYLSYIPFIFPVVYLPVYGWLLLSRVIKRRYVVASIIVFYSIAAVLYVVGYYLSKLP